jgi:glycosyltransferase involved in cell wall biosynthesis
MKLLSHFDRVWAVSQTSRTDLLGFWQWQGVARTPPVDVIALGANFNATPRVTILPHPATANLAAPQLLCLGIIEPRKNQLFLLSVCEDLWAEGLAFELHVVGRVNPHFGAPTIACLKALRRSRKKSLHFHEAATDETVARLYASSRASVFPTIAEGCGLPLLESLWMGVPCVCSDLPVLRENATGGGCVAVPVNDLPAWKDTLRRVLTDDAFLQKLCTQATERPLPTWNDAARTLASGLGDSSGR